jgi:hypothetical protein
VLVQSPASFWTKASVRLATVTSMPAFEKICMVGTATELDPRKRSKGRLWSYLSLDKLACVFDLQAGIVWQIFCEVRGSLAYLIDASTLVDVLQILILISKAVKAM